MLTAKLASTTASCWRAKVSAARARCRRRTTTALTIMKTMAAICRRIDMAVPFELRTQRPRPE